MRDELLTAKNRSEGQNRASSDENGKRNASPWRGSNPQRPDIPRPLALLLRERRVIRKSLALFRLSYTGFWLISEPFKVYIYQLIAMGSDTSEVERATFATISRRIPLLTDRLSRSLLVDGLLRRFRSLLRLCDQYWRGICARKLRKKILSLLRQSFAT